MQTILFLGGSGFIGTNLIEYLCDKGYQVVNFGRSKSLARHQNLINIIGDIRGVTEIEAVFATYKISCVFNALTSLSATDNIESCQELVSVNLSAFIDTVSLMRKYNVTDMVYVSSGGSIYGVSDEPLKEEHELSPVSFYGWMKEVSERYLAYEARINPAFRYLILRPANVYGKYQKFNRIIGVVLKNACLKQPVHIYGDINICKDYIHINDFCDITYSLLTHPDSWNEVYNVGSGKGTSIKEILNNAEEITGNSIELILHKQMAGDVRYSILNVDKVEKITGKKHYIPVKEGMRDMYEYVLDKTGTTSSVTH